MVITILQLLQVVASILMIGVILMSPAKALVENSTAKVPMRNTIQSRVIVCLMGFIGLSSIALNKIIQYQGSVSTVQEAVPELQADTYVSDEISTHQDSVPHTQTEISERIS